MNQPENSNQQPDHEWSTGTAAWNHFVEVNPVLGLSPGHWSFHNFLRHHRQALVNTDAIRRAKNRFWIAHRDRFCRIAFDLATGVNPPASSGAAAHGQTTQATHTASAFCQGAAL